jgi:hypothetical protein
MPAAAQCRVNNWHLSHCRDIHPVSAQEPQRGMPNQQQIGRHKQLQMTHAYVCCCGAMSTLCALVSAQDHSPAQWLAAQCGAAQCKLGQVDVR